MLRILVPVTFVLIWSTGFVVGKAALPHADLQLFLAARFGSTAVLMGGAALLGGVAWPKGRPIAMHALAGALMVGVYLCASYWAISQGLAAGVTALLGALQPLFTALFLVLFLRRRLAHRTWVGLAIGFAGVALVIEPIVASTGGGVLSLTTVGVALSSVLAVTAGALMQPRLAAADLRSASCIQNTSATCIAIAFNHFAGTQRWDGSAPLWASLAWVVGVVSVTGGTLLIWMMRHGEATKVTALFLLVPPLAVVLAYLAFHETLSLPQFAGFALALGGVLLARSAPVIVVHNRQTHHGAGL